MQVRYTPASSGIGLHKQVSALVEAKSQPALNLDTLNLDLMRDTD
jgi:hypothetical protein